MVPLITFHALYTVKLVNQQFNSSKSGEMWTILMLFALAMSLGVTSMSISTCSQSKTPCSRDSRTWKCCPDNQIAFPPIETCTNGTLMESKCFPSNPFVYGGSGQYFKPDNLFLNLTKLTRIYAVKLTFSHNKAAGQSVLRVQVKFQNQLNVPTFTNCPFAGEQNKIVTFYCNQSAVTFGDGVRIVTTDPKVDFAVEEVRIYEHPGIGCGYPGEDENGGSFGPRAESYSIGSRVRYTCRPGTVLFPAGSDERVCSNRGQWDGDVPRCVPEKNVTQDEVEGDLKDFLNEPSCRSFQNGSLMLKPSTAIHQIVIASKGNFDSCNVNVDRDNMQIKSSNPVFASFNKTKLKMDSSGEDHNSVTTTVYRSSELFPVDKVKISCSSVIELCALELTKREDPKNLPTLCPSPDGVANGSFSYGDAGLLYTCQDGYQLISEEPDVAIQCHKGKWTSLPPVCKRVQCTYPDNINGSSWKLLNQSTVVGSLAEYQSFDDSPKTIQRFVCTLYGQWAPVGRGSNPNPANNAVNTAYIQAYWVLVPFVLLVVVVVQVFHYRHLIYRRFCCCFHRKPSTQHLEAAYTNSSFPSDSGSGEFHTPELLPYNDEPDYPAEHLYESISVNGSLDNLATPYARVVPNSRSSQVL